jgi:predicted nucleic acid-binding Zn ribbon protein
MPDYFFICSNCHHHEERSCAMADCRAQRCSKCGDRLEQDYRAKLPTVRNSGRIKFFSRSTASDFLPDEVKGVAPMSKERLEYAGRSEGKNGRWI